MYMEKIRGLQCPYCGKPKYAKHPKVSIIIDKEGGRIFCEKCMTIKRAPSGLLSDALTEWVAIVGEDYRKIIQDWVVNLKNTQIDYNFFVNMRGFGDEDFQRYIECQINCTDY